MELKGRSFNSCLPTAIAMNVFREWEIVFPSVTDGHLFNLLVLAAQVNEGWVFPEEASNNYSEMHGSPAGFIILPTTSECPAVNVAVGCKTTQLTKRERIDRLEGIPPKTRHHRRYRIYNIFPCECGSISIEQYNGALVKFDAGLRLALKQAKQRAVISFSDENIGLEQIITSKVCLRQFQCYLQGFPKTFHPSDLLQLDRFTGCIVRHSCKFSPSRLSRYLQEDLNWTPSEAAEVERRIEIGIEVLKANRGR